MRLFNFRAMSTQVTFYVDGFNFYYGLKNITRLENNEVKFANAVMPDVVSNNIKSYIIPENWKSL